MIRKFARYGYRLLTKNSRLSKLSALSAQGLPQQLLPSINYLITGSCDNETQNASKIAEKRRHIIASEGNKKVPIWYSPKPHSSDELIKNNDRPDPGETLFFTMEKIARTGKCKKWGTVLHLLTKEFSSTSGIELGSCAGISAMYFSSAPSMKKFMTIEGSEALAEMSQVSLKNFKNAKVINGLFDAVLDDVLPTLDQKLDLAYIDGHHEKLATIHYFDRLMTSLKPGAIVMFDDVSWSTDMREAWDELSKRKEFTHCMDFGSIGVCILNTAPEEMSIIPKYWNLQPIVGQHPIGQPHGWK